MVDEAVISVLALLHIVSAVAWLGGVVFFLSAVSPGLRKMPPAASLEYLTKVGPRQVRFFAGVATGTIVFGLALLFAAFGTDYTAWPASIEVGFGLGLVAYLIAMGVTIPTFRKVEKVAHQMLAGPPGPPPPEFLKLMKRGNIAVMAVALILVLTAAFMIGTAFPF